MGLFVLLLLLRLLPLGRRRVDTCFLVIAIEGLLLLLWRRVAWRPTMAACGMERLRQVRLLQVPASALEVQSLSEVAGQYMGRGDYRPPAGLGKLLTLARRKGGSVHYRLRASGLSTECPRWCLSRPLAVKHMLERGVGVPLVMARVLPLQLPCLTLSRRSLGHLRTLCPLGWPVDVLNGLIGGIRGLHKLARCLLRPGHVWRQ